MGSQNFKATDCALWGGYIGTHGYGVVGRNTLAHRVAYERSKGPIPEGLVIDHLCRNPACVNPDHMEPVTRVVNTLRGDLHNRQKKNCPLGHALSGDNLYQYPDGRRGCRSCRAEARVRCKAKAAGDRIQMSERTECPAGHAYEDENTYVTRSGQRVCRDCRSDKMRLQYHARMAAHGA